MVSPCEHPEFVYGPAVHDPIRCAECGREQCDCCMGVGTVLRVTPTGMVPMECDACDGEGVVAD